MMVNNGFERYLHNALGDDVFSRMKDRGGSSFSTVMLEFRQKIKPYFASVEQWNSGGDDDDDIVNNMINISGVTINDDPESNIMDSTLTITG